MSNKPHDSGYSSTVRINKMSEAFVVHSFSCMLHTKSNFIEF